MIHTAALYIPRRIDEHNESQERIICVCGEVFEKESYLNDYRERESIDAPTLFARHLRLINN